VTKAWSEVAWPACRLGEALEAFGRRTGLGLGPAPLENPPALVVEGTQQLGRWIEGAAAWLGLEAEPVAVPYREVAAFLRGAGPALLAIPDPSGPRFLLLLGGDRRHVSLLTPGLTRASLPHEAVRAALCREAEGSVAGLAEATLAGAGVRGRRGERARQALLRELLGTARISGCWLLRPSLGASLAAQVREARLLRCFLTFVGAHAAQYGLWILSWWLLGGMMLRGRLDPGWLLAWLLVLLTLLPFRLLATAAGGLLAIRAGAFLKRRLLYGALRLGPDEMRHLGVGHLLGRVLESEAIESVALTGGLLGLTAVIELVVAGLVLGAGAGGWSPLVLLLCVAVATLGLGRRYSRRRRRWTEVRLEITNDLVERMLGHRTRLAQEARADWSAGEDQALERYVDAGRSLDRAAVSLQALVPRGWLILGLLALAPAFVAGARSTTALAVGVGGTVLAYRALRSLVEGLDQLLGAAIAWERVRLFWQAAARREPLGQPRFTALSAAGGRPSRNGRPLLEVRDLVFRHRDRPEPVLRGVAARLDAGDRLLLEGPSGGGKSTLAALLAGCREPAAGLLLLDGLDRATLGAEGWRRRVVLAPQFHDNHVVMGTLAFNLLLGRRWPPRPADLEEAESVCRALGLGPLLERMPAGLQQVVGETGWQLSHGEKSRLYLARALLQGADVVILDESFAALDPQTLRQALGFVLEKAPTVVVIAHP
jgi:ATP-binding cassette subfamily B protein